MKYSSTIVINAPIDRVVALFDDPSRMKEWMPGLQHFELIEGVQGQVGAKSKLTFDMGKRRIEMVETITVRNLPTEFSGYYEAKGVWNSVSNKFKSIDQNKTEYISEQEFRFSGFMKCIGFLFPSAFKKQTMVYLERFKAFVESDEFS